VIDFCLIIALAFHLLCVNVATSGPLLCIWLEFRESGRGDEFAGRIGRAMAWASIYLLIVGMILGVAAGAMLWIGGADLFFAALKRFPSKIGFGVWELVFFFGCMAAYIAWWRMSPRKALWQRVCHRTLAVLAWSNLLYHFPPLFSVISGVAMGADQSTDVIDAAAFRALMYTSPVLSAMLHFTLASIATGGVMVMGFAMRMGKGQIEDEAVRRWIIWGARVALVPTMLQIPVGLWVAFTFSPVQMDKLMGGDMVATILFAFSFFTALALMHKLASVAMGKLSRKSIISSMAMLTFVVIMMTGVLVRSRGGAFESGQDSPSDQPVVTAQSTH